MPSNSSRAKPITLTCLPSNSLGVAMRLINETSTDCAVAAVVKATSPKKAARLFMMLNVRAQRAAKPSAAEKGYAAFCDLDASHAPTAKLAGKATAHSPMRAMDLVAGNCAEKTYRMTKAKSAIAATRERPGLNRFTTYPTAAKANEHALVATSQRLLFPQPLALDRGSANGALSARAMRNGSAKTEAQNSIKSATLPTSNATHVRRNLEEGFGSLFMLHNV